MGNRELHKWAGPCGAVWRAGVGGGPQRRPCAGWRAASLGSVFHRALEARGEAGQRHPGPGLLWHTHSTTAAANEFWAAQGQGFERELGGVQCARGGCGGEGEVMGGGGTVGARGCDETGLGKG